MERRETGLRVLLLAGLVAASIFFTTTRDPEELTMQSTDGRVIVTGEARASQSIEIKPSTQITSLPLLGSAYQVGSQDVLLDQPVVLTFALADVMNGDQLVVIYSYHDDLGMWSTVPDSKRTGDLVTVKVNQLGVFAVGVPQVITLPGFLSAYEELRALAPQETVGYRIDVGYSTKGSAVVQAPETGEWGGCGGRYQTGEQEAQSVLTREVLLLVDDVETLVTLRLVGTWFTEVGEGCTVDQPLGPTLVL